jgi:hypothetical protein
VLTQTLAAPEFVEFAVMADVLVIPANAAVVAIAMQRARRRESIRGRSPEVMLTITAPTAIPCEALACPP